ncbi:MAG: AraC family transcriptional regulator [Ginsengibacter sp.]
MLKASLEVVTSPQSTSFLIQRFDKKGFEAPFHYHPEYELTYITEGEGKRFVGNNMTGFQDNDIVLIGSNLPHCWKLASKNSKAGSIVIQFKSQFLKNDFFKFPEMGNIQKLLSKCSGGIEFNGKSKEMIKDGMLSALNEKNDFKKLMILLNILNRLSLTKDFNLLNKKSFVAEQSVYNRERVNKVFAYIVDHFRNDVSLDEVAETIGMTSNAFCKYFKKVTRKTFMETVIDYRINFATQQLIDTDKSVTDICFDCGFRDVSHFYKMFSARKEVSPSAYRKQFFSETGDK